MHDELTEDYRDMIYAGTAAEIETRRKAFLRKWRLKCHAVADSLEEAGDRLCAFADGDGITDDDRAARLETIKLEIDEIERAEEGTIRTTEAAGVPIMRRANADPVALLLSDKALGL